MAPPKSSRDYTDFDAYVDGVLMKRSSLEGMFASWNQESTDAESLIPLLRLYGAQLKEEGAPAALQERVSWYTKGIYSSKLAQTHDQMKQVLQVYTDFNTFLQSDAGNGVNHFSRLLRLASRKGYDLSQVSSGFRSLSSGLELGLELDPETARSGPEAEAFKVSELLPEEEIFREKEEDRRAAPGTWAQRPEKRRQYRFMLDYSGGNEIEEDFDLSFEADLEENESLSASGIESVEKRAEYKPAKEWIRQFQSTHDIYENRRDSQGNQIPRTAWLLRLLAVRALVNARPGDKSFHQKEVSIRDIQERAEALARDPDMQKFLNSVKSKPSVYRSAMEYARKGTGSGLDTWVQKYMAANGLAPRGALMSRYLPSAELRVEAMKILLEKKAAKPEDKLDCMSQIIAARLSVGAKRGGFTGMDEKMKTAPGSRDFIQCRDMARAALEKLPADRVNSLLRKAREGHGGKLLESFSELTNINARNWREKAREQSAQKTGEQPRALGL